MANDTPNTPPGSRSPDTDGAWFLETVGAVPKAPTGSDALEELTRENEIVEPEETAEETPPAPSVRTTQVTFSSFDGNPGTSNLTYARSMRPATPGTPPPTPTPPTAPLPVAAPPPPQAPPPTPVAEEPAPVKEKQRRWWPVLVPLLFVVAAIAVAAIWLPQAAKSDALAVRQDYYDTSVAVRNQLPNAQTSLDAITNPAATTDELTAATPTIAQLNTLAFEMQEAADEPLPTTLPLVPSDAIDALVPLQAEQSTLAEEGADLAQQLGAGYVYRVSIPTLLDPGNLPIAADTATINTISVTLAASLAHDADIVEELPDDPTFAPVQAEALATHARYEAWQGEYLAALNSGDSETAQTLLDELDVMKRDLNDANSEALAEFRSITDIRIVAYASALETHMANLTDTD